MPAGRGRGDRVAEHDRALTPDWATRLSLAVVGLRRDEGTTGGWRVAWGNERAARLLVTGGEGLAGQSWARVTPVPVDPEGAAREPIFARLGDGRGVVTEAEVRASIEGDDAVVTLHELTDERGPLVSPQTVAQLTGLLDNTESLAYVKDPEGRYLYVNRAWERRFGRSRADVLGLVDRDLYPGMPHDSYSDNDAEVLAGGVPMEFEETTYLDGDDGEPVAETWLSTKFPVRDAAGAIVAVGGFSTDISARKRAEEALAVARDVAEQAARDRSELLSRVSHELRTPLNAILGFGQLLQDAADPHQAGESVERIVRAGTHLQGIIDDLLVITSAGAQGVDVVVESVDACAPLADALEFVRPLAVERGVVLGTDMHGGLLREVRADRRRLTQVLLNLLTNAVKHGGDGGEVRAEIETVGETVRYVVRDHGRGIAAADVERAFLPFERLGAAGGGAEGVGLGLAVSKVLVLAMEGRIGLDPEPDEPGSRFFVELPLGDEPGEIQVPPAASRPVIADLGPATVLHVEDTPSNVALVERILEPAARIRIVNAATGGAALAALEREPVDVVLLDLHLPDLSGAEVLRRIRASGRARAVPVVVLSADATAGRISELAEAGVHAYLTKPLDVGTFIETLRTALGTPAESTAGDAVARERRDA